MVPRLTCRLEEKIAKEKLEIKELRKEKKKEESKAKKSAEKLADKASKIAAKFQKYVSFQLQNLQTNLLQLRVPR